MTDPTVLATVGSGSRTPLAPISPQRPLSTSATPQQQLSPMTSTNRLDPVTLPMPAMDDPSGVVLGLEQLERQQLEQERMRQQQAALRSAPAPVLHETVKDDDTDPSSTHTGNPPEHRDAATDDLDRHSSLGRFIQNTRKRLSSRDGPIDPAHEPVIHQVDGSIREEDEMWGVNGRPLICGYLYKLGRNGKWQKRFFESDGGFLSYYKHETRSKLLATLDLAKVGAIAVNKSDASGRSLTIQVADRPYSLLAETKASCKDWVITLNRIKEARMQLGGVKLVSHKLHDNKNDDDYAARVVLVANRQRTRAVDVENVNSWEDLVDADKVNQNHTNSMQLAHPRREVGPRMVSQRLQQAVQARWQKRQTSLYRLSARLVRWARSVKVLQGCKQTHDQVVLDSHLHPPGHDDPPMYNSAVVSNSKGGDASNRTMVSNCSTEGATNRTFDTALGRNRQASIFRNPGPAVASSTVKGNDDESRVLS